MRQAGVLRTTSWPTAADATTGARIRATGCSSLARVLALKPFGHTVKNK